MNEFKTFNPDLEITQEDWSYLGKGIEAEERLAFAWDDEHYGDDCLHLRSYLVDMKRLDQTINPNRSVWVQTSDLMEMAKEDRNIGLLGIYSAQMAVLFPEDTAEFLTRADKRSASRLLSTYQNRNVDEESMSSLLSHAANIKTIWPTFKMASEIEMLVRQAAIFNIGLSGAKNRLPEITYYGTLAVTANPELRGEVQRLIGDEGWDRIRKIYDKGRQEMREESGLLRDPNYTLPLYTRVVARLAAEMSVISGTR
jgi:hypothetical protein